MRKNCLILAPPLCGARILAKQLVEFGYDAGHCLPSLQDPSLSSFEDGHTTYLNSSLFVHQKSRTNWNNPAKFNGFSFFLQNKMLGVHWPQHVAAPAVHGLQHRPWVRKDPQFIWIWKHWQTNVWELVSEDERPVVIMVLRDPLCWMHSIFSRVDSGIWPEIPKDTDYFRGLWIDYATAMYFIAHHSKLSPHVFATTLDHLCMEDVQHRLSQVLGLTAVPWGCFDVTKIQHTTGHQLERLDEITGEAWDKWTWTTLQHQL